MVRADRERVLSAALDLGDLARRRRQTTRSWPWTGSIPGTRKGPRGALHLRRRARLDLALRASTAPEVPGGLAPDLQARRRDDRARVLRDLGLDPGLSDREVLTRLLPLYQRLAEEPDGPRASLAVAGILDRLGNRPAAERLLQDLRRRHPGDPRLEGGP